MRFLVILLLCSCATPKYINKCVRSDYMIVWERDFLSNQIVPRYVRYCTRFKRELNPKYRGK